MAEEMEVSTRLVVPPPSPKAMAYTAPGPMPAPDNVVWPQDSVLCVKSSDFSHGDMAEAGFDKP